ncbi:MAG: hypothetical protein Q7R41_13720, partial [Phycisphaerales bacterium]|nr:hypothetical protein [Phycisphaerales bacterium]
AAIDVATGFATAWNPDCDGQVFALAASGTSLFVGGGFAHLGGQHREYIGAVDLKTGRATPWYPGHLSSGVRALAVSEGTLYMGGFFSGIGSTTRNSIAALDVATADVLPWNPNANGPVQAIVIDGQTLYVGGGFSRIGGRDRPYLAAFNRFTGQVTDWNPAPDGMIAAICAMGDTVYIGGGFNRVGGKVRRFLGAVDALTGAATGWSADTTSGILTILPRGNELFVGGQFQTIGGVPRDHLAMLDRRFPAPNATPWNPRPGAESSTSTVRALSLMESTLFVGGDFRTVDGATVQYVAAFDFPGRVQSPLRLPDGLFRLNFIGPLGKLVVFEASSDLVDWTPVLTNRAPFVFEDAESLNHPRRFYRATLPK